MIVYSGAIMVLFTFVIMLLNAGEEERTLDTSKVAYFVGIPGVAALLGLLTYVFLSNKTALGGSHLGDTIVTTADLSRVLFRDLLLPFEVTSVLILVAILGAVALARKEPSADSVPLVVAAPPSAVGLPPQLAPGAAVAMAPKEPNA